MTFNWIYIIFSVLYLSNKYSLGLNISMETICYWNHQYKHVFCKKKNMSFWLCSLKWFTLVSRFSLLIVFFCSSEPGFLEEIGCWAGRYKWGWEIMLFLKARRLLSINKHHVKERVTKRMLMGFSQAKVVKMSIKRRK